MNSRKALYGAKIEQIGVFWVLRSYAVGEGEGRCAVDSKRPLAGIGLEGIF